MMIWCVEDDESIRDIELYTLQKTGFESRGFENAETLKTALEESLPDLLFLDIMLPGIDGVEILRQLRLSPATSQLPIIMATAKSTEFDKVQSLDLGADDYLVKPFGMMEMISRVKAVLRRANGHRFDQILQIEGLILNPNEHTVTVDERRVSLTFKEYELLKLFLSNPGTVFTREQLFAGVWGDGYIGESRTIDMHIRTLRQKIWPYDSMVQTVRGVGYRFEVHP